MPAPRFVLDDFWPSDLFLGGIPGAWYDPTDVNVNWRRNLLTFSEDFGSAAWAKANITVSSNSTTAPDGTLTADTYTVTATLAAISYQDNVVSGSTITYSIYAKQNSGATDANTFAVYNNTTATILSVFTVNYATGAISHVVGSGATATAAGNGWWRLSVTHSSGVSAGNSVRVYPCFIGNPENAGESAFIWGAQLEVGSTASAYQQIVTPEITYAATQTTNLFQDSTGTTPVWAVEQPVGLILDKSQGLAQGSQLVVNGDGTTLAGWTTSDDAGCSSTVSGGQFVLSTVAGGAARLRQTIPTTAGKTYAISIFCNTSASNATAAFTVWGAAYGITTLYNAPSVANGVITAIVQATSANIYLQLSAFSGSTGLTNFYDNVSVRELAGNHASQSTAASRPTYRARYNLLTFSEQFQNAAWTTFGSTSITADATTAPDGTATADKFVAIGAGSIEHLIEQSTPPQAGVYTISAYAKPSEYSWIILKPVHVGDSGSTSQVSFNMSTQTWDASGANRITSYGFQALSNGWFRVFATFSITSACTSLRARYSVSATASPVYVADLTSGAFIWGAQLLTAADVTATGNAYQRIAAATVYDTAPIFRPYLAFDGVDDSLSTAAINFTSTDKMSVFSGVTKNSDSAYTLIAELTTNADTFAGGFNFFGANQPGYYAQVGAIGDRVFGPGIPPPMSFATAAPTTDVVSLAYDRTIPSSVTQIQYRIDAQGPSSANLSLQGVGASGVFANAQFFIGRRNNASFPFNGRLFSLIVRGAASSVTEIADTELWVNARTGAY